jgi:ATP/maltotriose-dependent transcriptional regulator MalT
LIEEAMTIGQELSENAIIAIGLIRLGRVSSSLGDYDLARSQYEKVLSIAHGAGIKQLEAVTHSMLASLALLRREDAVAFEHLRCSNQLWRELPFREDIGFSLLILAMLLQQWQQAETAAQLLGAAERALPFYSGLFLSSAEVQQLQHTRRALQAALGKERYQLAWQAGQALTLEEVLDLADSLQMPAVLPQPSPLPRAELLSARPDLPDALSARELEVLRLVAEGATNQEIARKLYIDIGTVKSHNTHIFAKLGVKNRTQAVQRAQALGLL